MNHLIRIIVALLVLTSVACRKKESHPTSDFDFQKSYSISSEFNDTTSELDITIHLPEPLHAYATGEKVGKPVTLVVTNKNGWEAVGEPIIPLGEKKKLGELGESVVLQGNVHVRQKLKRGQGPGEAQLLLQVCTDKVCDRPRTHNVPLISGKP